jgi:hypothetical protein
MNTINLASGQSSIKEHLFNGSKTMCRKSSFHKNSLSAFVEIYKKSPETCCKKCATYLINRGKL